jgi:hypothetical protein
MFSEIVLKTYVEKIDSKNKTKKIVKEIKFELKIQLKYDSNFKFIFLSKKSK